MESVELWNDLYWVIKRNWVTGEMECLFDGGGWTINTDAETEIVPDLAAFWEWAC